MADDGIAELLKEQARLLAAPAAIRPPHRYEYNRMNQAGIMPKEIEAALMVDGPEGMSSLLALTDKRLKNRPQHTYYQSGEQRPVMTSHGVPRSNSCPTAENAFAKQAKSDRC